MKQLLWIAMILAASAAAGQTDKYPPPQPAAPVATPPEEELTEITVSAPEPRYVAPTRRDRIGRIWAPVYLDGKGPFRLVLDTGASHSAITARVADALGEHARTSSTVRVRGVTGTAIVPIVRVSELAVGDLVLAPIKLPVVLDVFGGADGVLGNEGLHDKRIVIDFRHDSISIRYSRRERPGYGYSTVPVTFAKDYLPIIDARVGRVPVKAIIDTGAPDSLGNMALLNALKQRVGDTTDTEIVGVTLDVEHVHRARMPTIYFQGVQVRGAALSFGDVYIFQHWRMTSEPSIMLGMDVLGTADQMIIDYKTHELHILTGSG
jgi:predicted aspartyl protease